jgi:hypothetical protein
MLVLVLLVLLVLLWQQPFTRARGALLLGQ